MYEAFFGLQRRPFAATPDPNCWFHGERLQAAFDELLVCAQQGQGIGILVAPAGVGKTLLCERLIREVGEPFTSVLLRHATYTTRKAFLQTLLCELAQPYDKPTDQELRLGLAPVLRGLGQDDRALLLVVDEAHLLSESLLEELRILADQSHDGRPLVRLILTGQFSLEEKLAHPALQALNQRVRAHVTLEPLSQSESADYLDYRLTWAGGRTDELFSPEALELICRAADGVPRCLNQLCDHALLLAYVSEERRVSRKTVREALQDLKHLPLPWNLVSELDETTGSDPEASPAESLAVEFAPAKAVGNPSEFLVPDIESTFDAEDEEDEDADRGSFAIPALWNDPPSYQLLEPESLESESLPDDGSLREEVVVDRYAALDAGLDPVDETPTEPEDVDSAAPANWPEDQVPWEDVIAATIGDASTSIEQRLATLNATLEAISAEDSEPLDHLPTDPHHVGDDTDRRLSLASQEEHLGEAVLDTTRAIAPVSGDSETSRSAKIESMRKSELLRSETSAVFEFGAEDSGSAAPGAKTSSNDIPRDSARPFRNLFTLLRRKQQGRM